MHTGEAHFVASRGAMDDGWMRTMVEWTGGGYSILAQEIIPGKRDKPVPARRDYPDYRTAKAALGLR